MYRVPYTIELTNITVGGCEWRSFEARVTHSHFTHRTPHTVGVGVGVGVGVRVSEPAVYSGSCCWDWD